MKTKGKACEDDRALLIVSQRYLQTASGVRQGGVWGTRQWSDNMGELYLPRGISRK